MNWVPWIQLVLVLWLLGTLARQAWPEIRRHGLLPLVIARLLLGVALIGVSMWIAMGIDAGTYRGQTEAERSWMVGGMLVGILCGVVLIVSVMWIKAGARVLPWKLLGIVFAVGVALMLLFESGTQVERRWGIYHDRPVYLALAVAVVVLTLWRPWWFWEHAKARIVRDLIGDRPTILLYLLIAGGMGWWAVAPRWGPEHAMRRWAGHFSGRLEACYQLHGAALDGAALGDQIAYAPGFETGFAIWLPRVAFGDTTRQVAYDGRWHRTPGDTTLVRIYQEASAVPAEIVVAPGRFPRTGRIELPQGAAWGNDTLERTITVEVDSTSCSVAINGSG